MLNQRTELDKLNFRARVNRIIGDHERTQLHSSQLIQESRKVRSDSQVAIRRATDTLQVWETCNDELSQALTKASEGMASFEAQ